MFVRGIAVGAIAVLGLSLQNGAASRQARLVAALTSVSIISWLICESQSLWRAIGRPDLLTMPALAVGGMFWLFVMTLFDDRPVTARSWAPAAILFFSGPLWMFLSATGQDWL